MELKHTIEEIITVDSRDLDMFIQKLTGSDYECVASEEWSNDSQHRFVIDGKIEEHDRDLFRNLYKGKWSQYSLRSILQCLCAQAYILPGTYLIKVCW